MRKSKQTKKEILNQLSRLKEIQVLNELAEAEEKALIERVTGEINKLCEDNGLYCGVILSPKDIGPIVEVMADNHENVRIGFQLSFIDNE
jgi:hypothetical protein